MCRMRLGGVDIERDDGNPGAFGFRDGRRQRNGIDRLQEYDGRTLVDEGVHQTRLHLDLVLPVEKLIVDDLLGLQDFLDALRPCGRDCVRLPLNEGHLVAGPLRVGLGYVELASGAVQSAEQRARRAAQCGRSDRDALEEIAAALCRLFVSRHLYPLYIPPVSVLGLLQLKPWLVCGREAPTDRRLYLHGWFLLDKRPSSWVRQ